MPIQVRLLFCMLILSGLLHGPMNTAQAQATSPDHLRILLLLDDSGSMDDTDPANLRYTAARIFIAGLDAQDEVGAIRFATTSSVVARLQPVGQQANRDSLLAALQPVEADGYTDVRAAFEAAAGVLPPVSNPGTRTVVLLITDGKPEIPAPYAGYEEDAIQAALRLNVPVYAVALTPRGLTSFLTHLTGATGGQIFPAADAAGLIDRYLEILGTLKDRTILGQANLSLEPALAPYIDNLTFIISVPAAAQVTLLSPNGEQLAEDDPAVRFWLASDPAFMAVSLNNPPPGKWKFVFSKGGQGQVRAIARSRLRARILSPAGLQPAGQPLQIVVNLLEEQPGDSPVKIIGEASFSALITRPDGNTDSLDAFYDDGTHGDQQAGDGNFTRLYVDTILPGEYVLVLQGNKGLVPVSTTARLQIIRLPEAQVEQPLQASYVIRPGDQVPLALSLPLADTALLDFEGGYQVRLTTPNAERVTLPLEQHGGVFSATYHPQLDGTYRAVFEPVQASYLGMPVTSTLQAQFEAQVMGQAVVTGWQMGLPPWEGSRFELQQAVSRDGLPLVVTITSTAGRATSLLPVLEDLPGFELAESGLLNLPAGAKTSFTLHLLGQPGLSPGVYGGRVRLLPQGNLDLAGADLALDFELFQPTISMQVSSPPAFSSACLQPGQVVLHLQADSNSFADETIILQIQAGSGLHLDDRQFTLHPGRNQLAVTLHPDHTLAGSPIPAELSATSSRPGVVLAPVGALALTLEPPSPWNSCKKPLIISGWGVLAAGIITTRWVKSLRKRNTPPRVTGTLLYWRQGQPQNTTSVNLNEFGKASLRLGRAAGNEVVLPDETLEDLHAVLLAERSEDGGIRLIIRPVGAMWRGYRPLRQPVEMETNLEYRLGEHIIQYIPDLKF